MTLPNLAQATDDAITIVRVAHPPLMISDLTAEAEGLTRRRWRALAREMLAAGLPVRETTSGYLALRSDVERHLRTTGATAPKQDADPILEAARAAGRGRR